MSAKLGRKCSVRSCSNYQQTERKLSFFRFPKNPVRCNMWLENADRRDSLQQMNTYDGRVCARHFEKCMFANEMRNRLEKFAVPTLHMPGKRPQLNSAKPLSVTIVRYSTNPEQSGRIESNPIFLDSLRLVQAQALENINQADFLACLALISVNEPERPVLCSMNRENVSIRTQSGDASLPKQQQTNYKCSITSAHPYRSVAKIADFRKNPTQIEDMPRASTSLIARVPAVEVNPPLIFSYEQERQLAGFVRETAVYYSGLTSHEIRVMAYVYGVCNSVQMPAAWMGSYVATHEWCAAFVKRNNIPAWMITT